MDLVEAFKLCDTWNALGLVRPRELVLDLNRKYLQPLSIRVYHFFAYMRINTKIFVSRECRGFIQLAHQIWV